MPKLTIIPHSGLAASGAELSVPTGTSLCDALLDNGIDIEHACGKVGACTTCHVIVRNGFPSLSAASEQEEDMLDRAWGVEQHSRLSCQALIADADLTIELPRYSVNHAKENG